MQLDERQIERYTHHIILKDIGGEGQKILLSSKVLVVGAGGLGSPALFYLAAAGVGTLGIVDNDKVGLSNLQRQIIHATDDIGKEKVRSAKDRISALNPDVKVVTYGDWLDEENISPITHDYDFIIDGSDNFTTKFLINDTSIKKGMAYSHAGVTGFKGQTFTYAPGGPCLRCIFKGPPPPCFIQDCRGGGILGATAGVIGSIQAAEAIKYLLKKDGLLTGRLLYLDTLTMKFQEVRFERDENCPSCSTKTTDL